MQCFVYKGSRKEGAYLYLPQEGYFDDVPDSLMKSLGELSLALSFDLGGGRQLAQENADTVLTNLKNQGFHLQMPSSVQSLLRNLPGAKPPQ